MENINLINGPQKFIDICTKSLDKFAPRKKKYSRSNNMPFMNKLLSRAHMKKTRLRNCYLKTRSEQNRLSYVEQRNYCVSLLTLFRMDVFGTAHGWGGPFWSPSLKSATHILQ